MTVNPLVNNIILNHKKKKYVPAINKITKNCLVCKSLGRNINFARVSAWYRHLGSQTRAILQN